MSRNCKQIQSESLVTGQPRDKEKKAAVYDQRRMVTRDFTMFD